MENNTASIATVASPLPERNPDSVVITCPLFADLHGYAVGETASTLRMYIYPNCRDKNGYEIWVHSIRFNRSVWVSDGEYSLTIQKP